MDHHDKHFAYQFNKERHNRHIGEAHNERQAQAANTDETADDDKARTLFKNIINMVKHITESTPKPDASKKSNLEPSQPVDFDSTVIV